MGVRDRGCTRCQGTGWIPGPHGKSVRCPGDGGGVIPTAQSNSLGLVTAGAPATDATPVDYEDMLATMRRLTAERDEARALLEEEASRNDSIEEGLFEDQLSRFMKGTYTPPKEEEPLFREGQYYRIRELQEENKKRRSSDDEYEREEGDYYAIDYTDTLSNIASYPETPSHVVSELLRDEDEEVRMYAADRPDLNDEQREYILASPDAELRKHLLQTYALPAYEYAEGNERPRVNKATPSRFVDRMLNDPDGNNVALALAHPNISQEALIREARGTDAARVRLAAKNPNLPWDETNRLSRHPDPQVRRNVVQYQMDLSDMAMADFYSDTDDVTAYYLYLHPSFRRYGAEDNRRAKLRERLATSDNAKVRKGVAEHTDDSDTLRKLGKDPDNAVREAAKNNSRRPRWYQR